MTASVPDPSARWIAAGSIPFARPSITHREESAVLDALRSGWLSTGPRVKEFEKAFAAYVGTTNAIAVNSATAALHLALEAFGVGPGDEVIVPTWTFAASAEVIVWLGAKPVLVDVEADTLNSSPDQIMRAVTPRTKAVVAVHLAGLPMDVKGLVRALDGSDISVLEDTAHAFPSQMGGPDGPFAGTVGRAGAYSFYATKTMTTGEGGMLVTDDQAIADRARMMSLHGISRDAWNRYSAAGTWYYEIHEAGYKDNMTDLAGALGLVQLDRAQELLAARRQLVGWYLAAFAASTLDDLIELPGSTNEPAHAWHLFVVRLRLDRLHIDRAEVIDQLKTAGIGTSVHFIPLHRHPYYRRELGATDDQFPVASAEFERVISLPLWPGMSHDDVERVVTTLGAVLRRAQRTPQ